MTSPATTPGPPLDPGTIERLRKISTPTLCPQLYKLGFRNTFLHGVRPLCPERPMAADILVARLHVRGAAGLVLDGGIRDYPSVQAFGFPVYALGPAAPAHVARHVAVDENVPIGCAEVLVLPGDIMVGH